MTQDLPAPAQPGSLTRRAVPLAVVVAGAAAGAAVARTQIPAGTGSGANSEYGPGGAGYGATAGTGTAGQKPLAALAKVPAGGGLVVPDAAVVLTRDKSGTVHAFSSICTHQGCTVSGVANGTINCPCHGSRFDASTGAVVNGPASSPLPPVAVTVRGDDIFRS